MLWLLSMRFLLVTSLVAWWFKRPNANFFQTLLLSLATLVTFWVVTPNYAASSFAWSLDHSRELFWHLQLDTLLLGHANMLVTLGAVVWLLNRTWQTLWKPTSDLISILGVDVPEPPDVSLAGIRADAATLSWTRPASNRPVQKFLIQVNGVNVGESRPEETAITVTGLRPNHCYNVRVIAVGPNNFQAGSPMIRLRTYKCDGRPELGNSRVPDSFQDQGSRAGQSQAAEDTTGRTPVPSIEAAPSVDGVSAPPREGTSTAPGQRRNTLNRRHSPSVASQDQPVIKMPYNSDRPEPSLKELADALEKTRREIDETLAQYSQEEADFKKMQDSLRKEKEKKKQTHKEKDDQTTQLKQKVKATYEQMRQTNKEKARKESVLKEKQDKRRKMSETVDKCNTDVGTMKKSRDGFSSEREHVQQDRDLQVKHLSEENAALQEEFAQLEAEYKERKEQLKELEDDRKQLPGGEEDERWKEEDRKMRRDFDLRRRELQSQLIMEDRRAQQIENHIHVLHTQVYTQQQSGLQLYGQANSSGVDFDQNISTQVKRRSRASNNSAHGISMPSPPGQFASAESIFPSSLGLSHAGFAPGPFMDMSAEPIGIDQSTFSDAEIKALTGGAPLSPTATALLPSGILMDMDMDDDDPPSPISDSRKSPAVPDFANDTHSPASSGRHSYVSSPHNSSYNLPFTLHHPDSFDRRSIHDVTSSPGPPPASSHRLTNLLASFNRNRGVKDATTDAGPALGSLKHGQSQSFPRQTEEDSKRKISFSSNWFNRAAPGAESSGEGMLHSSKLAKRLNPFGSSSNAFADRIPSSPRPASIASADLPRPSTDSGSIWGAPGDNFNKSRIWSPDVLWQGSRNPSRRPSIHGSPAALKTTLASADDEILDEEALLNPQVSPSQVGVIGSRPPPKSKAKAQAQMLSDADALNQQLNPNAPTFMAGLFRPKDKDTEGAKDKTKGKAKDKSKATTPSLEAPPMFDESPTDSRKSRDAFSVHTQTSVSVTESRESLSLERTFSNTPSDNHSSGAPSSFKDQESAMRKLFRKGSSSKFSLSSRLGKESGLFKKGPGSTTNSDKNYSMERSSIGDIDDLGEDLGHLGRSYDSVGSSPSLGPSKSKESKEGRIAGWSSRFSMNSIKKKGKEAKESLDIERSGTETEAEEKKEV
ncbi:hypothetical protein D7B24_000555 [Verticillium nonalfalfae]|uniref:Fibronectin type-III domain-containing protein n=1 Tax=Verticillium nonalfalfae TaxID=1051616 RepID=A0A3M9Y4J9_9PEZI|nr:uncharacterized protein D7B24_000555 [Verticillium nonalfalfae]RNJ54378.1 hypothetical protein D7B24_000555 [Verticillium nonalfalfae]